MMIYGLHDSNDGKWDGGEWVSEGIEYQGSDMRRFDPARDQLTSGDRVWFENPGVEGPGEHPGWHAIYQGQNEEGQHKPRR